MQETQQNQENKSYWDRLKTKSKTFFIRLRYRMKTPASILREVKSKDPVELLQESLKDEKILKETISSAKEFQRLMAGQWFDLRQVINKTKYNTGEKALKVLNLMKLSGVLIAEMRNDKEMYKIVLTKDQKLIALNSILNRAKEKVKDIEDEITKVQKD